jgi:hypothetical protein
MTINRQIRISGPSAATTRKGAVAAGAMDDDFDDADFCKDVYEPTGAAYRLLEIETAFTRAGYDIKKSEWSPHGFPVVILRLRRTTAAQFTADARLADHVGKILAEIGIHLRTRDITAQQIANRILIAFPNETPQPLKRRNKIPLRDLLALLP